MPHGGLRDRKIAPPHRTGYGGRGEGVPGEIHARYQARERARGSRGRDDAPKTIPGTDGWISSVSTGSAIWNSIGAARNFSSRSLPNPEEKNSIAIASNESFSGWTNTFTGPRLCAAIVDRITFNGAIIATGTDSYRLVHTLAHQKHELSRS